MTKLETICLCDNSYGPRFKTLLIGHQLDNHDNKHASSHCEDID